MSGVHDGHRQRMRERIRKSGLFSLAPHEILEYLLFAYIPRKDTNVIAHALIDKFGSFSGVLSADEAHLKEVAGMTDSASLFLANLPEVFRAYADGIDHNGERIDLSNRGKARAYMGTKLYGFSDERVLVVALDAHDKLIRSEILSKGSGNAVELDIRSLVDFALKTNASSLLLAHNHPSGNVTPSQSDYERTKEALFTLAGVGVALRDHMVFCGSAYYSFEEHDLINKIKTVRNGLKEGIFYYE